MDDVLVASGELEFVERGRKIFELVKSRRRCCGRFVWGGSIGALVGFGLNILTAELVMASVTIDLACVSEIEPSKLVW